MPNIQLYRITDFSRGIVSDYDSIDAPENSLDEVRNIEVYPGGFKTRKNNESVLANAFTDLKSMAEFKLPDSDYAVERFLLFRDDTTIKKSIWTAGTYGAVASVAQTNYGGSSFADFVRWGSVKGNAYGSRGLLDATKRTYWYGYIERDFFNDAVSQDGWYLTDSFVDPKDGECATVTIGSNGSTSIMKGQYFFRWTYTYDGYQESAFYGEDGNNEVSFNAESTTVERIDVDISYEPDDLNARHTHINIYCAWSATAGASTPDTAYYLIAHVDLNDSNWALVSGDYDLSVYLESTYSNRFPDDHTVSNFDDPPDFIIEELYNRNNALVQDRPYWGMEAYDQYAWINQRLFVTHPIDAMSRGASVIPYDRRQVVCFSDIDKPDVIHFQRDYIDVSTEEGDEVTGLAEVRGNLIILKENNMFKIFLNNSGRALDWTIDEHFQKVGCVAKNGWAVGNGKLYFPGRDNIYVFDGFNAVAITKFRNQADYKSYLSATYTADSDYDNIFGVFDPNLNQYKLLFASVDVSAEDHVIMIYDVDRNMFIENHHVDDYTYYPNFITMSVDHDVLGGNDTRILKLESSYAISTNADVFSSRIKTKWLTLTGDPHQEKRLKFLRGIINEGHALTNIEINVDYTEPVLGKENFNVGLNYDGEPFFYKELSHLCKVVKVTISDSSTGLAEPLDVRDIEIGYEVLDVR